MPIIKVFVQPVTAAIALGDKTVDTVNKGIDTLPTVASEITGTFKGLVNASQQVASITPLSALATTPALQAASNAQRAQQSQQPQQPQQPQMKGDLEMRGGSMIDSDLNALPYTLLGTIAFISIAGFAVTYYRSKKNVKPEADDSPPEPGVLRESDKKESVNAA